MFRTVSILGLGVVFLIVAFTAMLFSIRITSDESWNPTAVLVVVAASLAAAVGCMVYFARRREREDYLQTREAAALDRVDAPPPNQTNGPHGTAVPN